MSVQREPPGTGSRRSKAQSALQFHSVAVWRGQGFGGLKAAIWSYFLLGSESSVRHRQPQAEPAYPSLTWCFSVARARFWRLEGCNLELVSCRLGPAAAGRRPKAFSCVVFQGGEAKVLEGCNLELASCPFRKQRYSQAAARRKAWPVLQLHGVSAWRGQGLGGLKAAVLKPVCRRFRKKR